MKLPQPSRFVVGYALAVAAFAGFFVASVLQYVGGPLIGPNDTPWYEYGPYLFLHNLKFTPWPQLDLVNDQAFYPYGTNSVFTNGALGPQLFVGVLQATLGYGPWPQLAFLSSLLIACAGTYWLLVREYGPIAAACAAFVASFGGFYTIDNYPEHMVCGLTHWAVLSVVYDHLLVRRLWLREGWSLPLLLGRGAVFVLNVGQMLAYAAGIGLASFVVSGTFAAGIIVWRLLRSPQSLRTEMRETWSGLLRSGREQRNACLGLTLLMAVTAYFYVPLNLQIVREASQFVDATAEQGAYWANPLRLLVPIFPGLHPCSERAFWAASNVPEYSAAFHDLPEKAFDASIGWHLLLAAAAGLVLGRRQFVVFVPTLVLLALFLAYHPLDLPTLKIFPWFGFARVTGRFTVIYPVSFAILGLGAVEAIRSGRFAGPAMRAVIGAVGLLFVVETATAYVFLAQPKYLARLDADFYACMRAVRESPGEAILDWPFCVAGGDGNATPQLGAYFGKQSLIQAIRRFHGKKIVGQYTGRLPPKLYEPFLRAGWQHLFLPNDANYRAATGQWRDFTSDEWAFFDDFFRSADFCGLLLYTDLLPPAAVAEFHRRYGPAKAAAQWIDVGRIEFIPKPAALRAAVDLPRARSLVYLPPHLRVGDKIDLSSEAGLGYLGGGWRLPLDGDARWTDGVEAALRFSLADRNVRALRLDAATYGRQVYIVGLNGRPLGQIVGNGRWGEPLDVPLPTELLADENVISLGFPGYINVAGVDADGDRVQRPGLGLRTMELLPK
jgi:hypothetical protein